MPEPTIEDLQHYLAPEWVPDQAQIEEIRARLTELGQMQELFSLDGWRVLASYLDRNIAQDRTELETCKAEAIGAVRSRLTWWRYLLNLPQNTVAEATTLRTRLEELEPTEHEEDA